MPPDEKRPGTAGEESPEIGSERNPDGEDFASMLEASLEKAAPQGRAFEVGQSVEGVIVAVGRDAVFVDIGGKGEASMNLEELRDSEGNVTAKAGDRIKALVVSAGATIEISRKLAQGAAAKEQLEAAHAAGLPVDGRVEKVNKGGYDVRVSGVRGFCPLSQIDIGRVADPEEHVGRTYTFRILEYKEGGRNIVLSRRALLEEEAREKAREVMKKVVPGAVLPGRIASVTNYGAFVDLGGGVNGLLHVSEMAWTRVASPSEIVQPGQELAVQVLKVDEEGRKISLSLKHLQEDPWQRAAQRRKPGQTIQGRVTRHAQFGAFVEIEPGVEGLAHVSTFPATRGDWKELAPPGSAASFRIESIDVEKRRISLAWVEPPRERSDSTESGASKPPDAGAGFGSIADKMRAALNPKGKKG